MKYWLFFILTVYTPIYAYRQKIIGFSRRQKPIKAFCFSSGKKKLLLIGGLHGNEQNTVRLLQYWIKSLKKNEKRIPVNLEVIIIPCLNPDGAARGTRLNRGGVDLNRNFATADWS
ncbi:MAG TPA: DUF2817 domain-containing protein, partial [Spirochaetota bacterium]|nr:DUF2817 domain-containing protein [Spirochaetota bacterium]